MDLSDRSELAELSRTLRPVAALSLEREIPWLLIGAAGRDLLLGHVLHMPPGRATLDVDVAIQVETWDRYRALRQALIENGWEFDQVAKMLGMGVGPPYNVKQV